MIKLKSSLFVAAVCSLVFSVACSDDEVAGGAVEDYGIVADLDTVFVHDSVFVDDTIKVVKRDTVTKVKRDTVTIVEIDTNIVYMGPISGMAQKGPFVKGSNVTVFELDGTNKLLQTGRSFGGTISADDGSFTVRNVSLASSYVCVTAKGYFRKELDGSRTTGKITLRALSDLNESHTVVNVNVMTHLEYDRVVYLMGKNPKMTLSEAKKQAEKEIFAAFSIDADKFAYAENLNIFGISEADAALLAVSVVLSGDASETEIANRLSELSKDLAEDGKIDDEKLMNSIALWTMNLDFAGDLAEVRKNIVSWGYSGYVPDFEKFMRKSWSAQLGMGECGSEEVPVGTIYDDSTARYFCVDSGEIGFTWRLVQAFEEDTLGLGRDFEEGAVHAGLVHEDSLYVFNNGAFRKANRIETLLQRGCTAGSRWDTLSYGYTLFECQKGKWVIYPETGTVKDSRDTTSYATVGIGKQMWMAKNAGINVLLSSSSTEDPPPSVCGGRTASGDNQNGDCAKYGRFYTWEAAAYACPTGYRLPTKEDWEILVDFVGGVDSAGAALRSTDQTTENGWYKPAAGAPNPVLATDEYGFNAISAGERTTWSNGTGNVGQAAVFWSLTESENDEAYYLRLSYSSAGAVISTASKTTYKSVRCIKQ